MKHLSEILIHKIIGLLLGLMVVGFTVLVFLACLYDPHPTRCLVLFSIWWIPTGWIIMLISRYLWFGK